MGRMSALALTVLALLMGPAVAAGNTTDLYGCWIGTWYVDEQLDWEGAAFGEPPYPTIDFELTLQPYDPTSGSYGVLSFAGLANADVVALSLVGDIVTITGNYAPYSNGQFPDDPAYYFTISGILADCTVTGDFDEADPPIGWISWRGPFAMALVPEPATIVMVAVAGLWAFRRRVAA